MLLAIVTVDRVAATFIAPLVPRMSPVGLTLQRGGVLGERGSLGVLKECISLLEGAPLRLSDILLPCGEAKWLATIRVRQVMIDHLHR